MGLGLCLTPEELERKPIPITPHHCTLERAWRRLCADMLSRAILSVTAGYRAADCNREEAIWAKEEAARWLQGGRGVVTFEQACEGADMDPAVARMKIEEWKRNPQRWRLRRWRSVRG